jgi:hypothetical protein
MKVVLLEGQPFFGGNQSKTPVTLIKIKYICLVNQPKTPKYIRIIPQLRNHPFRFLAIGK